MRAGLPSIRFRAQQSRHGLLCIQVQLGVRANPACLSIPLGARSMRARFEPAQSQARAVHRRLEALASGAGDPAWSMDHKGNRLTGGDLLYLISLTSVEHGPPPTSGRHFPFVAGLDS